MVDYLRAIGNGFSQLIFLQSPWIGLVVLLSIFVISPLAGACALAGSLAGIAVTAKDNRWTSAEWQAGISSYNPIILGIFWSGAFRIEYIFVFVLMLLVCIAIDNPARRHFEAKNIPLLSGPAIVSGVASQLLFDAFGVPFWAYPALFPLGEISGWMIVLLISVIWLQHSLLLIVALILSVLSYIVSYLVYGYSDVGLWGFTVSVAAVYPLLFSSENRKLAVILSVISAVSGSITWVFWDVFLTPYIPALLIPMILGIWFSLFWQGLTKREEVGSDVLSLANLILDSAMNNKPVVFLTGAGMSTASDIPDYVSSDWLNSDVPVTHYHYSSFLNDSVARAQYWDACHSFKKRVQSSKPNRGHVALTSLEDKKLLSTIITQNVDGLHQAAGSHSVIELHGSIHHVHCLQCGVREPWPEEAVWWKHELLCPTCGGFLKPDVVAMGENISPEKWRMSVEAVKKCGCLIIAGSRLSVSPVADLLRIARENGATIIVVNQGKIEIPLIGDNEFQIDARTEEVFPMLESLLSDRL